VSEIPSVRTHGHAGTQARQVLLGGWEDIADDVRRLVAALDRTPDGCGCGQGEAHLAGTGPCCSAHGNAPNGECTDCVALLQQLRPKVDALTEDTLRCLPALLDLPAFTARTGAEARQVLQARMINLTRSFDRVTVAVAEFERGCSTEHLTPRTRLRARVLIKDARTTFAALRARPRSTRILRSTRPSSEPSPRTDESHPLFGSRSFVTSAFGACCRTLATAGVRR
jgi:hypothetical protein